MRLLIDHLWQSTWVVALTWMLAWLTRSNPAALRLWLWRAAALKFLMPFALLHALGGWLGFPVRHSAIAPPAWLTDAVTAATRWTSPAQYFSPGASAQIAALTTLLALVAIFGVVIARQVRRARRQCEAEVRRLETDWNDQPPPPGFFATVTISSIVLALVAAPMLAGAVQDRLERQEALAVDVNTLRSAKVELTETRWRFGDRTEIIATPSGTRCAYP